MSSTKSAFLWCIFIASVIYSYILHIPMSLCFLHRDNTSSWHHNPKQLSSIWCFQLHFKLKIVSVPEGKMGHGHWLKNVIGSTEERFLKSGRKFPSVDSQEQHISLLASYICVVKNVITHSHDGHTIGGQRSKETLCYQCAGEVLSHPNHNQSKKKSNKLLDSNNILVLKRVPHPLAVGSL